MCSQLEAAHRNKKGVVFTARIHPGETNASYMLKGALDFLLGNTKEACLLRRHFVFRVVPMLNPDGVIYGNYRCSLLGVDLNRRWKSPSRYLHPTVYYTKRLIQYFSEQHELALYCDMHGHSMKKNVFMYACRAEPQDKTANALIRLMPKLLARSNKLFSYPDCHFRLEASKQATARVVIFKELGVLNSYTLEASFYGPQTKAQLLDFGPVTEDETDAHMSREHMETLGKDLCKVLLAFVSKRTLRLRLGEAITELKSSEDVSYFQGSKDMHIVENEESGKTDEEFNVQSAMQVIAEAGVKIGQETEDIASEGGSDSLGSDNDDQKQDFIYRQKHPKRFQRAIKRPSLPNLKRPELRTRSSSKRLPTEPSPVLRTVRTRTPAACGNQIRELPKCELPRPGSQRQINRIYKLCNFKVVKALQVDSPKPALIHPIELLSEWREAEAAPRVKVVVGVGGQRNSGMPSCPSAVQLSRSEMRPQSRGYRCGIRLSINPV